jgi:hypothetical protein
VVLVPPIVRYLIACEDVKRDPTDLRKVTLVNLINAIRSVEEPFFSLLYRELCVFVQLTECRGSGEVEVRLLYEETGDYAYPGPESPWKAGLPNDPLEAVALLFRIRNLTFPGPGLYWIQFLFNGEVLSEQQLLLRTSSHV